MLGLLLLAACDAPTAGTVFVDYAERVGRVLERSVEPMVGDTSPPRARAVLLPLDRQRINWSQFAELHQCDLGDLAGYRNSGLGRLQGSLERLTYETVWLRRTEECLARMPAPPATVQSLYAAKRTRYASQLFNAVIGSEEMLAWLGTAESASTASAHDVIERLAAALPAAVGDAGADAAAIDLEVVRRELEALRARARFGAAVRVWEQGRATLIAVAQALEESSGRVCRTGAPTPRAKRLQRVFQQFYLAGVQPLLASRIAADRALVEAFAVFVERVPVRSAAFEQWYEQTASPRSTDSAWNSLPAAARRHASAWQALAEECGLKLLPLQTS